MTSQEADRMWASIDARTRGASLRRAELIASSAGAPLGISKALIQLISGADPVRVDRNRTPAVMTVFLTSGLAASKLLRVSQGDNAPMTFLFPGGVLLSMTLMLRPDEDLYLSVVTGNLANLPLVLTRSFVH